MSGYKHATVTISQEEYRRLHDGDMKRRFREFANLNEQTSNGQAVHELLKQMEDRQRQLEDALASSSSNQNTEQNGIEFLQDTILRNRYYFECMVASLQETNSSLQDSLMSLSNNFSNIIQQEREDFQQRFFELISQQEAFNATVYEKENVAHQWLSQCFMMLDFIQQQYDPERFAPGRVGKIYRDLNMAESNVNEGFSESSLQFSQKSFLELSDLNVELEQATLRWHTDYARAFSSIENLVYQLRSNSTVNALGLDGEELPDLVDLDYWTKGKYQQLLRHCQQYQDFMTQNQTRLSIEDLDRIYNQIAPTIRESFESIIYEARLGALNSQLRMNIAETALEALETHGFTLDQSGYEAADMRSEFNAHLVCSDGTEISVQVLPTESEDQELTNELVVITTHPYLKTEHEARMRWDELNRTLNHYNLRVSQPNVINDSLTQSTEQIETLQTLEQKYTRTER